MVVPQEPEHDARLGHERVQPFLVQRLSDVVPVSLLQTLETGLTGQHGSAVVIIEPDNGGLRTIAPEAQNSAPANLCQALGKLEAWDGRCRECQCQTTREMLAEGPESAVRQCDCRLGVVELAIPIVVDERVVAVLFSGQRRLTGTDEYIRECVNETVAQTPGLSGPDVLAAIERLEELTSGQMQELSRVLQRRALEIAKLGQDRCDVERRLRQEYLLNELMMDLAQQCDTPRGLEALLHGVLERVNDFFRLSYSASYAQGFPGSVELTPTVCAGDCAETPLPPLRTPVPPPPTGGETTFTICADPRKVAAFMAAAGVPPASFLARPQALICDFGAPGERATLTIFGPQREGHTETLLKSAGDDFLERYHFEIGMRVKVARLLLELRQSDEDKTQFLAQTTHEINAGLQTIVQEAEWLQYYVEDMAQLDDEEINQPIERIMSEVLRLGARARSSLFHLRGGMPRTEYKMLTKHPLDRLLADCIDPFRTVAASRNIHIQMDEKVRHLPHVAFDWEMLKIVFMNLVDNAVKYSHFNRTIRIYGEADENWVTVAVEDFGLGIPESEYNMIFEPYVRGTHRDPRRFIWGSGLGLAVAREIVESHGGEITVRSVPRTREPVTDPARAWENYVTTFTVRLPLRQEG
jgi:signal transduction histidine kinase/ligand-binding sensor protein